MTMIRLLPLSCALLALSLPLPARADVTAPPAMARDAANALLPAARNNLGLVPGAASGVMPSTLAPHRVEARSCARASRFGRPPERWDTLSEGFPRLVTSPQFLVGYG